MHHKPYQYQVYTIFSLFIVYSVSHQRSFTISYTRDMTKAFRCMATCVCVHVCVCSCVWKEIMYGFILIVFSVYFPRSIFSIYEMDMVWYEKACSVYYIYAVLCRNRVDNVVNVYRINNIICNALAIFFLSIFLFFSVNDDLPSFHRKCIDTNTCECEAYRRTYTRVHTPTIRVINSTCWQSYAFCCILFSSSFFLPVFKHRN